jgi:hypothetical protein
MYYEMAGKAVVRDLAVLEASSNEAAASGNAGCGLVAVLAG